jgi:CheY-like chemotaxis protein
VKDTGIGIAKEKQEEIFESFRQADCSTTRKYGGTGLGTTIAKQLTELMGGAISVESDGQSGSTFSFTIMVKKQMEQVLPAADRVNLVALRVLVVDDKADIRKRLIEDLNSFGCAVEEAGGAREALSLLDKTAGSQAMYDLVVTSLQMTGMDGFGLAAAIRARADMANVAIIGCTSAGYRGDGRKCLDVGLDAYLAWPISRPHLQQSIRRARERIGKGAVHNVVITKHILLEENEDKKYLQPARILLVEDYPTNQKLVIRQLRKAGYQVDLAENGQQAVGLYLDKPKGYDLVLMDIQMPVMDGYEATALIREFEKAGRRRGEDGRQISRVPIIAMTGHALKSDREKCLAADMDDYLSKPIRRKELLAMVEKWALTIADSEEEATVPSASAVERITGTVMNFDKAVQEFEGDREFLVEVLRGFLVNVRAQVDTIQRAITADDAEVVRREAHAIKGGAANLTAEGLRSVAFELENLGGSGELTEASGTLARLEKEFGRLDEFARSLS